LLKGTRIAPEQGQYTMEQIKAKITETEGDLSLQPEIDNAAEARLHKELKGQDELNRIVTKQAAKRAKYTRQHEQTKVSFVETRGARTAVTLTFSHTESVRACAGKAS
jgi:hypothetical protein